MTRELRGEGLAGFEPRLSAAMSAEVVRDIQSWAGDEQLAALHDSLHAHTDERTFLNAWAEALVARHLLAQDCRLRFEVPTPSGKRCDFEVTRGEERFYLHVKRVNTDRPTQRSLPISSRLRILERIERPYIVKIRWHEHLTDEQMMQFVRDAEAFILRARIGDEHVIRAGDDDDAQLGALRILAPSDGTHVSLVIGLREGFMDESLRMRRLMQRAEAQFMPRATNVIMLCSSHENDARDFETALLGTHIERWDRFPPRGQRIAHGRDADGFWYAGKNELSQAAGWFRFSLDDPTWRGRLWMREQQLAQSSIGKLLVELFEDG